MGCWLCNPLCGNCKPPWRQCVCPQCGKATLVKKDEYLTQEELFCKHCGASITREIFVKAVKCGFSGLWCAYPCGKSKREATTYFPCSNNTALEAVVPKKLS